MNDLAEEEDRRVRRKRAHADALADPRRARQRQRREASRAAFRAAAVDIVKGADQRDVLLLGCALYWSEGAKPKRWRPFSQVVFTNGDPRLVALFLAFLAAAGIPREEIGFRLSIHETADARAALDRWAAMVGVPVGEFRSTHVRRRAGGGGYRGCLEISVRRGRDLYWWIEGVIDALVSHVATAYGWDR